MRTDTRRRRLPPVYHSCLLGNTTRCAHPPTPTARYTRGGVLYCSSPVSVLRPRDALPHITRSHRSGTTLILSSARRPLPEAGGGMAVSFRLIHMRYHALCATLCACDRNAPTAIAATPPPRKLLCWRERSGARAMSITGRSACVPMPITSARNASVTRGRPPPSRR